MILRKLQFMKKASWRSPEKSKMQESAAKGIRGLHPAEGGALCGAAGRCFLGVGLRGLSKFRKSLSGLA